MKKTIGYLFVFVLGWVWMPPFALAEGEKKGEARLEEIVVTGEKFVLPTKEAAETVYTGVEVTPEGLRLGGEKTSQSVWEAVSLLPGVVFEGLDPAGLSTQSGVRIRGISGSLGSLSVEGVPIYGGNPIGPRSYILDLENFKGVAVYKGAVPADLGPGAGTRGGTIELRPLWALDRPGILLKSSLGSFNYQKGFLRLDSGKGGPAGTRVSLSASYADEDKWKGPGQLGPRKNLNFTLVQPVGGRLEIKLWGNVNDVKQDKLRPLTYAQISDPEKYDRYDYSEKLTGKPSEDWQSYPFNTIQWTNYDLYAFLDYRPSDNWQLVLKPYYRKEKKEDWAGSSSVSGPGASKPGVQNSGWTARRWGTIGEISAAFSSVKGLLGYQYEQSDWLDSITSNYWLNADGSLTFVGWGRYTEGKGASPRHSPYAKISGSLGKFNWQAGLKYLALKESANEGYLTQFDAKGNPYLVREPKMDYGARTYTAWLPTLGASYLVNDQAEVYSSFGRTFQQPYAYMPLINMYYALYNKLTKMGITLEDLFKEYKPEITDNLDLGLRFRKGIFEFNPTLFFSKHTNLNTTVTPGWKDPEHPSQPLLYQGNPVSYNTFVGRAKGYGLELGSWMILSEHLTFFVNPTFSRLVYEGDIISGGTTYTTDGKQVVNVPEWSGTAGLIAKVQGLEVVPKVRYVGERQGNISYQEKLDAYTVVDLYIGYTLKEHKPLKDMKLALEVNNLFGKKYIVAGYYPGVPFSVLGSISFAF